MNQVHLPRPMEDRVVWPDDQVAELLLLLPGRQAAELERLAHSRGLTLGQQLRLLIHDYLTARGGASPGSNGQEAAGLPVRRGVRCDPHALIRTRGDL
jgi:hypothetical protein